MNHWFKVALHGRLSRPASFMLPMKHLALFCLLLLSTSALAQHPAADEGGFVPLFNGKDLTGWKTTGNWLVEPDGSVSLHPREGEKGW